MRVEPGARDVVLRVTDHGPGIPAQEQALVFEPFHGSGTGLGLAITRGFVELNGGRIWIESPTGRGTTFAVAFPTVRGAERVAT
jgi:two-component system sensor histidine kinase KdpD